MFKTGSAAYTSVFAISVILYNNITKEMVHARTPVMNNVGLSGDEPESF